MSNVRKRTSKPLEPTDTVDLSVSAPNTHWLRLGVVAIVFFLLGASVSGLFQRFVPSASNPTASSHVKPSGSVDVSSSPSLSPSSPSPSLASSSKIKKQKSNRNLWLYSQGRTCDESMLQYTLTPSEQSSSRLSTSSLSSLVEAFRACGVVVIHRVIDTNLLQQFKRDLDHKMEPHLESRSRVRTVLKDAIRQRRSLQDVWEDNDASLQSEVLFHAGDEYRERNDGRIDMTLPLSPPSSFSSPAVVASPVVLPLLKALLGDEVRLKGIQAVVALNASQGNIDQHWHRDTDLLFVNDPHFSERDTHHFRHGIHEPPYAINLFMPLVDINQRNGPTEFTLGSHMWGQEWRLEEEGAIDRKFSAPVGSVILFDYRTVHRGTQNNGQASRPIAMLVYGRSWWTDAVNYGPTNYGGKNKDEGEYFNLVSQLAHEQQMLQSHKQLELLRQQQQQPSSSSSVSRSLSSESVLPAVASSSNAQHVFKYFARLWSRSLIRQVETEQDAEAY